MDLSLKKLLTSTTAFFNTIAVKKPMIVNDTALLVIDVQREFCDPQLQRGNDETLRVSERIATLLPEFRKAGMPVYLVYFSNNLLKPAAHKIDFFKIEPETTDTLVRKKLDSAFEGGNIHNVLQVHGRKKLLVCGFNTTACVKRTALSAVNLGYNVELLLDISGDDKTIYQEAEDNRRKYINDDIKDMQQKGIKLTTSHIALNQFKRKPVAQPANNR